MGNPITMERIHQAVVDLYGSYDVHSNDVKTFIEMAIQVGDYEAAYSRIRQAEEGLFHFHGNSTK